VPERASFDYAPVWVVPRVERDEVVAAGLVMRCLARDFLLARVAVDEPRLRALDPAIDLPRIERHLEAIVRVSAGDPADGPVARLPPRDRWHWLVAPRSAVIQIGPVHVGLCEEPRAAFDRLFAELMRVPQPAV
jgi:hypothetical protein